MADAADGDQALDPETEQRIEEPLSPEAVRETRLTPAEAVADMRVSVPVLGTRSPPASRLVNDDDAQVKAWWHVSNVNAVVRLHINDHSWVHIQIVTNIALKLLRQLTKNGVEPSLVRDYGLTEDDTVVAVVLAALFHFFFFFLRGNVCAPARPRGLQPLPRRAQDAGAARRALRRARAHGRRLGGTAGDHQPPLRRSASGARGGILRVADALDMAKGRSGSRSSAAR